MVALEQQASVRATAAEEEAAAAQAAWADAARANAEARLAHTREQASAELQAERAVSAQRVAAAREGLVDRMARGRLERQLRARSPEGRACSRACPRSTVAGRLRA